MTVELTLEASELCALIEALHDHMTVRARWTFQREQRRTPGGWADLDLPVVQRIMDDLMNAYAKAMMALSDFPEEEVHESFRKMITPPPQLWELMSEIGLAQDWRDVPVHEQHDNCDVCSRLAEV